MKLFLSSVLAFCLINLWAEAAEQDIVVIWTVGSRDYQFSEDFFFDFMECACGTDARGCYVYRDSNNSQVNYLYHWTQPADQMQETYSNVYNCEPERKGSSIIACRRVTATSCDFFSSCWSYMFTRNCALGQVVFTWVGSETFSQVDNNFGDSFSVISSCSRSCTIQTTTVPSTAVPQQSTQSSTNSATTERQYTTTTTTTSTTSTTDTTTTSAKTSNTITSSTVKSITAITSSSTLSTTDVVGNAPQKEDDSNDTGIIVGVVIAVLVIISALIVGGIFCWRRRKNAENADKSLENNSTVEPRSTSANCDNSENTNNFTSYYENVLNPDPIQSSSKNVNSYNKDDNNTNSFPSYENVL